jgi:hypothetical protein
MHWEYVGVKLADDHDYDDDNNINNNQVFYSQVNWGRLDIKPHERKNRYKTIMKKKRKIKDNKKLNKKEEKTMKH